MERIAVVIPKSRRRAFRALRKKMSDRKAAAISWAGRTLAGRKLMARKAAATRRRRGRR